MHRGRRGLVSLLIGVTLLSSLAGGLAAQESPPATPAATPPELPAATLPQPSFDVLRVEHNGVVVPYHVWFDWLPVLTTTPDSGAWIFFSAQARPPEGSGPRRLYASRFDPSQGVWLPAQPIPGGDVQFGPAAVVDSTGVVHVVYSDRAPGVDNSISTLLYTRTTPEGTWQEPVAVAPDPNAGHQMMPSLAISGDDVLHLVWRDQRTQTSDARAAMPANADLFASDYVDGAWTTPVQIETRFESDINVGWPHLAIDGDRLVAVWSVYKGTTPDEMLTASRVDWSTRPIADVNGWATAAPVLEPDGRDVGGRQIDVEADPTGGVILLYGRYTRNTTDMFLRRLPAGAADWDGDIPLSSGDFGYLPSLAMGPDGTAYVVFNSGRDRNVKIGGLLVKPGSDGPYPLQILTPAEAGLQVRAASATDADGRLWVAYLYGEQGSNVSTEIRALRGARVE